MKLKKSLVPARATATLAAAVLAACGGGGSDAPPNMRMTWFGITNWHYQLGDAGILLDGETMSSGSTLNVASVSKALQAVKGSRQVIFVTHNPNIPVLGEAERVFVFSSDGQHATLKEAGTVDECKVQIERILEGGREAFLRRKARYGH